MDAATTGSRVERPHMLAVPSDANFATDGTPQRDDSSAVFGSRVTERVRGCNSRNFKTTAPAEISVTGMHIPAGTGAAVWEDHGAGRPECAGMSAHA
jgi:hypothetical protein